MSNPVPTPPKLLPHLLPPRPLCRPGASRAGTLCFWTVLLMFLAALGFLAMLAYNRNAGQWEPSSGSQGHLLIGALLVGFAIVVLIGVISNHHEHQR